MKVCIHQYSLLIKFKLWIFNFKIFCLKGGLEIVTKERKWAKIANKLGYLSGRSVGSILKVHYERILYPYDVFKLGKTLSDIVSNFSKIKNGV